MLLGTWNIQQEMECFDFHVAQIFSKQKKTTNYTPGSTNIAGWKMGGPGLSRCSFPVKKWGYYIATMQVWEFTMGVWMMM